MSRTPVPLTIADTSAFARSLRQQLGRLARQPTHVEMLNMLARAGGHRNFQHLRAAPPAPITQAPAAEPARVDKVLRCFDETGRMLRWPSRTSHQELCVWGVWAHIPGGRRFSEAEINGFITDAHCFGDYAILRRTLVEMGMLARTPDGRIYRRIEQPAVSPEAAVVLAEVKRRANL